MYRMFISVIVASWLFGLMSVAEAKPWKFLSASQRGDVVTVIIEDTGDTATVKRTETVTYYLQGKNLDATLVSEIKVGLRAKVQEMEKADTTIDRSNLLDPH